MDALPPKSGQKRPLGQRIMAFLTLLNGFRTEFVVFLMAISLGAYFVAFTPFVYHTTCVKMHFGQAADCLNVTALNATTRKLLQHETSTFLIVIKIACSLPAIFSAVLLASYSDKHGRKGPLIIGILGFVQIFLILMICSAFERFPIYTLIPGAVLFGVSGHVLNLLSTCFAMAADQVTDQKTLTVRIGLISGLGALGIFVGSIITGVLVASHGYTAVFLFSLCVTSVVLVYAVFLIHDTRKKPSERKASVLCSIGEKGDSDSSLLSSSTATSDSDVQLAKPKNLCQTMCDEYVQIFRIFTKPRSDGRRSILWMTFGILFYDMVFTNGTADLVVLYTKRSPLNWDTQQYSILVAVRTCVQSASMPIGALLFKKLLKQEDSMLLMAGYVSMLIGRTLMGFSNSTTLVLLSTVIFALGGLSYPAYRSIISRLVEHNENARVFAMLTTIELTTPMLSTLMYNNVYNITLDEGFPGLVFEVAAAVTFPLLLLCWLLHNMLLKTKANNSVSNSV